MNTLLLKAKVRAAAIHLTGCVVVGMTCWALVRYLWYPVPLLELMGGGPLFVLLLLADVTLGPVLTLVAFNPSKPRHLLILDYAIILGVQVFALVYGVHVLHSARPAFVVFAKDRFSVVRASDLDASALAAATVHEYRILQHGGPRWVSLDANLKDSEALKITMAAAAGGVDIDHYPRYYRPLEEARTDIAKVAKPISEVWGPVVPAPITYFDASAGGGNTDLGVIPIVGRARDAGLIVDRQSGAVLGYVDADPWPK
ncbi:MAG: hypothetical protein JNK75_13195 [Betaproteobacteria bacterium]|nr:hypothetical protein [Betaproteobacteria bacterium]